VGSRRFSATLADGGRGNLLIRVPFDPDAEWGTKPRHPIAGTIDGRRVRGNVESYDGRPGFTVGPAWLRGSTLAAGDRVEVEIAPEGPQRDELAEDVAEALSANPAAANFFDGLAQFYRRGYLRWIDATTRNPELRQQRIATTVELLAAGVKDYHDRPAQEERA
jgi:hypothetical protein